MALHVIGCLMGKREKKLNSRAADGNCGLERFGVEHSTVARQWVDEHRDVVQVDTRKTVNSIRERATERRCRLMQTASATIKVKTTRNTSDLEKDNLLGKSCALSERI